MSKWETARLEAERLGRLAEYARLMAKLCDHADQRAAWADYWWELAHASAACWFYCYSRPAPIGRQVSLSPAGKEPSHGS